MEQAPWWTSKTLELTKSLGSRCAATMRLPFARQSKSQNLRPSTRSPPKRIVLPHDAQVAMVLSNLRNCTLFQTQANVGHYPCSIDTLTPTYRLCTDAGRRGGGSSKRRRPVPASPQQGPKPQPRRRQTRKRYSCSQSPVSPVVLVVNVIVVVVVNVVTFVVVVVILVVVVNVVAARVPS